MIIWWKVRRLMRFTVPYIEEQKAYRWERRLRFLYIFFAWNGLAACMYYTYKRKQDPNYKEPDLTRNERWAKLVHAENPTYVRIKGFTNVEMWTQQELREKRLAEERLAEEAKENVEKSKM